MAVTTVETGLAKDESAHGAAAQSYPTHALDNTYIKTCTIFLGLVISGRLSPELLKDAALTLISQWPELGGYIDSSTTPATIHPDATGGSFDFKARRLEGKTLASTALPCPNEKSTTEKPEAPQFYPIDAKEAEPLFHFESMDSMGRVPKNIFALRATVLDDATLLGFRLPHMFSDGEGTCEVVKAFATVLSEGQLPKLTKRPSTISLALNLRPATNGSTGKQAQAQVKVQEYADKVGASKQSWMDFRLGVMGFLNYITRGLICGISESMVKNNKPQHMLVKLPGPFVASLKAKAIEDLTSADGKTSADISTNDAISAYLLQSMTKKLAPSKEPIHLYYPFSIRPYLTRKQDITLHNCYYDLCMRFPSRSKFQSLSLGSIAAIIRKHILSGRELPSIAERIFFFESQGIIMPVPQDKPISAYNPTPIFTSWIRFGLWGSNFSGAAAEGNNGNVGRVVGLFPTLERPLGDRPRRFAFITKDEEGDFWVDTKLSKEEWAGFEGVKVTYSALEAPRVAEAGTIST